MEHLLQTELRVPACPVLVVYYVVTMGIRHVVYVAPSIDLICLSLLMTGPSRELHLDVVGLERIGSRAAMLTSL